MRHEAGTCEKLAPFRQRMRACFGPWQVTKRPTARKKIPTDPGFGFEAMIASKFGLDESGIGGGALSTRSFGLGLADGTGGGFATLLKPNSNAGLGFGGGSLLGFSS